MNAIMQPSDIERQLLQQQQEQQQLHVSQDAMFAGTNHIYTGGMGAGMGMCLSSQTATAAGLNSITNNNSHSLPLGMSHDQKVNPKFSESFPGTMMGNLDVTGSGVGSGLPASMSDMAGSGLLNPALLRQDLSSLNDKRKTEDELKHSAKKMRPSYAPSEDTVSEKASAIVPAGLTLDTNETNDPPPILPSKVGQVTFDENDVLSGRGGGTNVHPGNRNFRDLINLHRRAYLKARKNDKPAISRAIVRSIRGTGGKFLKKDEKTGLWFEIGDDAAREKTSQALRQRAPEMRKLLFDSEDQDTRGATQPENQLLQHQRHMLLSGVGGMQHHNVHNVELAAMMARQAAAMGAGMAANMNGSQHSSAGGNDTPATAMAPVLTSSNPCVSAFNPNLFQSMNQQTTSDFSQQMLSTAFFQQNNSRYMGPGAGSHNSGGA